MSKIWMFWAIGQGLLSAVFPQFCAALAKKTIGTGFENTDALETKPECLRRLRALGVGLAAFGVAALALDRLGDITAGE